MSTPLATLAETVDEAARTATAIPQLSIDHPYLGVDDGYAIQALSVARRLARGERRVGVKMGLTSRAKMVQVGVDEVIWGRLTDAMRVEEGGEASFARYVHPRVEPEIAFLMADDLSGNVSPAEAMSAVEAVAPALEIIDSRYRDFKFSLPDVVADNSSSSGFVVGNWRDPETDLSNLGMILEANGRPVQMGSSAAILGDPVRALVAAARMVARWGEKLEAGMIVLAGAATAAHPTPAGTHMRVTVQDLGAVSFTMAE
ncbi:MAG: fumarylacetoacetate hydrolase family protein [Rhodobacterales bacterium]|nr:fumarylacetoacetate hydrolase family protein [Rhodobacterales bacterium]